MLHSLSNCRVLFQLICFTALVWGATSVAGLAQRVDLDRYYVDAAYQQLPQEPVDLTKRTYGLHVTVLSALRTYTSPEALYGQVGIAGWKKVEQEPTVGVDLALEDFVDRGANVETKVVENKDRDGKVLSRTTTYFVVARYASRGYCRITGPSTPAPLTAKQAEEKKKKEEATSTNRFLKNAVINKPANTGNEPVTLNFSRDIEYRTAEYADPKEAMLAFENNKQSIFSKTLREFVNNAVAVTNGRLNIVYGYPTQSSRELFWILDAKGEEGATQQEAIGAMKAIFADMKADEPIDNIKTNLEPIIAYLESLKGKYTASDKPGRKMRYSAYYNLARIYLLTDQPDKAIKEAEALIANDYDTRDGEGLIDSAKQLTYDLDRARLTTRHIPSMK